MIIAVAMAPNETIAPSDVDDIARACRALGWTVDMAVHRRILDARMYKEALNKGESGLGEKWAAEYMRGL